MILVNCFKSKMTAKYLDSDIFCDDPGSDYVQKIQLS